MASLAPTLASLAPTAARVFPPIATCARNRAIRRASRLYDRVCTPAAPTRLCRSGLEVSRGWSCGQAVSEMVELGPSLVERLLCAGSTRICAAFEHVRLIQTNYRDQASQNLSSAILCWRFRRKLQLFRSV